MPDTPVFRITDLPAAPMPAVPSEADTGSPALRAAEFDLTAVHAGHVSTPAERLASADSAARASPDMTGQLSPAQLDGDHGRGAEADPGPAPDFLLASLQAYQGTVAEVRIERPGQIGQGWNGELSHPQPDTAYVVTSSGDAETARFLFITDDQARTVFAAGVLEPQDGGRYRNVQAQAEAGIRAPELTQDGVLWLMPADPADRGDRRPDDHGGHIFAFSLNGPGERINLVAMSMDQNGPGQENWYAMERHIRADLAEHPGQSVEGTVRLHYGSDSLRPDLFSVKLIMTDGSIEHYTFENGRNED